MTRSPALRVGRSAGIALAVALLLASVGLGVSALLRTRVHCEAPGSAQCSFETDLAFDIARLQALEAAGCACVGLGRAVWLRARRDDDRSS